MEERFLNISWHPALEDIIDNVFIRDERMVRESAMYRIMNDEFRNPLADIESEYAEVDLELIQKYLREDNISVPKDEDQEVAHKSKKEKPYVPGIRKLPFYFPRRSRLDKSQQTMCLRVLLRLRSDEKKAMTEEERREFQEYMTLQEIISEEQKEFLEFAKSKWNDSTTWMIKCNKFIAGKWKTKMKRFEELPRYYAESISIPLSVQKNNFKIKDIKVTFVSCLRQGTFPNITLPRLDQRYLLYMTNPLTLLENYSPRVAPDKVTQHFKLPVSEDTYCESLAREAEADFVISSSGLKCLLNNMDPDYSNSWFIPVVVKSHREKNIVYIDKKLPPTIASIPQKNTWVYKYILRYHFVDSKNESSEKTEHMKKDKSKIAACDSDLENESSFNDYLKDYEEALYSLSAEEPKKSDDLASGKINSNKQNVSYKLFTIGPTESSQHERIKHGIKEYKMLVRTKTDGIETLSKGESQYVILAPKMEHQLGFGAEAITLEEGLHQWASLKFRPKTSLARVRIAADSAEIIQIERHTTISLNNEIKRLYDIKVEDSLSILYNIIERLLSLTPGQYIMQHVPQNGPFAYVYEQAESGKNIFDLHSVCKAVMFETTPKIPWPPIDNMMPTPALKCFYRMPAMFNPISVSENLSGKYLKKNASGNTANKVLPRRSGRLNKT